MPREYEKQRDQMQREGMSKADAEKWAAINYWKKHHVSVNTAAKREGEGKSQKKK